MSDIRFFKSEMLGMFFETQCTTATVNTTAAAVASTMCFNNNTCHFYFLNNAVKHWLILIIFGKQHQEKT